MKTKINKIAYLALIGIATVSCTQYADNYAIEVTKPAEVTNMEYVNAYGVLKSYVNYSVSPNFRLGAALQSTDYITKETLYQVANSNFMELTASNQMKYNTIVGDDGVMDFTNVKNFIAAAEAADMTIFGHTLCWHHQQSAQYLNGLIAPTIIPGEKPEGGVSTEVSEWVDMLLDGDFESGSSKCVISGNNAAYEMITEDNNTYIKISNTEMQTNAWDSQIHFRIPDADPDLTQGETYRLTFKVKSDGASTVSGGQYQSSFGGYISSSTPGSFNTTTEWSEVSLDFQVPALTRAITFCIGNVVDSFYLDDCKFLKEVNSSVSTVEKWVDVLEGGDFENGTNPSILKGNNATFEIIDDGDGNHILQVGNTEVRSNVWDAQLLFVIPDDCDPMAEGETYRLNMKIKSDYGSSFNPIRYMAYVGKYMTNAVPAELATTTEWSEVTMDFITPAAADQARVLGLCFGTIVDNFYIDDCSLSVKKIEQVEDEGTPDTVVEMTDEEKRVAISDALSEWIKAMMEACDGYVKSWDVVNEPMDDGNADELKSGEGITEDNTFYWQDYLGKDYARYAVKYARQYGGNDMLLFINEYNLEATYNNNDKCRGLIKMIEYWESDGETKIDGIGTQMHINYNLDADKQAQNEECVVTMFELLAASGKLIKISELDMGVRSGDTTILTSEINEEIALAMADYYEFIITKYFEIIPATQQYGITQWCITDSAADSGWRAGEPSGLWSEQFVRKHAYTGFANGLSSAK